MIDLPIPGDIIGLRSVLLHASDHSFATITDVTVAEISARQLVAAFEQQPRLGVALLWAVSHDEAMVVEHLLNCGTRSAMVRTAHFLVELGLRLQLAGLGSVSASTDGQIGRFPCFGGRGWSMMLTDTPVVGA